MESDTIADQDTAKFRDYFEAGAAYRGLIPGRDLDLVSLGYLRANINSGYQAQLAAAEKPVQTNEEHLELNYTMQVTLRIPTKPATNSNRKPATDSDLKPAGIPI